MPKKIKRKVSTVVHPAPAPEVMEVETVVTEVARPTNGAASYTARPASFSRRTTSTTTEFNPDYTYVVNDLKRIGTLAGTFFVILIALSFIIR